MAMFSNKYQEEIAEIMQQMLDDGYTKLEVINLLADVISYSSAE